MALGNQMISGGSLFLFGNHGNVGRTVPFLTCLCTTDMVEAHHAALKTFASQHDIAAILVEGVPRAFCAGLCLTLYCLRLGATLLHVLIRQQTPSSCAGGDIKSIREYALEQPYKEDPPVDHPVARVSQNLARVTKQNTSGRSVRRCR